MADGVIRFSPNARQWQDGATAEHFIALPGLSSVTLFDKPRPLPGQVFWHNFQMQFPKDAVLVKTISLDVHRREEASVETQILHYDGEDWRGYTYAWRDDQTDADLVPPTAREGVHGCGRPDQAVGKREQMWTFHSRTQCISCHNSWAEYALAFNPVQLNGRAQATKGTNQLVQLDAGGLHPAGRQG